MSQETDNSTKAETPAPSPAPATPAEPIKLEEATAEEELLSLEDLDKELAGDEEFSENLAKIGPTSEMDISEEDWGLPESFEEERRFWHRSGGWRRLANRFFPPIVFLGFLWRQSRIKARAFRSWAVDFAITLGPRTLKALKAGLASFKKSLTDSIGAFGKFSLKKKLSVVGLLALVGATGFVVYRATTKGLLPPPEELFIGSMAEWSQEEYVYDPETETENFYESTHNTQNIMLLPRMVVNLHRTGVSGANPMGAFEFYVEGTASDVLIEVKDREGEIRDLFQRAIEDMTFEQLSTAEGKQLLTEKLRKEVNKVLSKGKIRRVFIKTILIKP